MKTQKAVREGSGPPWKAAAGFDIFGPLYGEDVGAVAFGAVDRDFW